MIALSRRGFCPEELLQDLREAPVACHGATALIRPPVSDARKLRRGRRQPLRPQRSRRRPPRHPVTSMRKIFFQMPGKRCVFRLI